MRRGLLAAVLFLTFAPTAQASWLSKSEALRAADRAVEEGPWVVTRHSGTLIRLDNRTSEQRAWDAPCPEGFGCSPDCQWTETTDSSLRVWVRELRHGYRVRDSLGFALTLR